MIISNRYKQFYTLGKKIVDISKWETNLSQSQLGNKYGWEGAMAYGNLIHDDLNRYGPGIKEGDVYVDLGANIGMSALFAEKCKASKIYCVEPDVDCYEILAMNKSSNWVIDNVAIGESEGYVDISIWPDWTKFRKVRAITFDQYIAQHCFERIDFLKVDVEGHETVIFNNVTQSTWDIIDSVFIEYHENITLSDDQRSIKRNDFINKFRSVGFINTHIHFGYYQSFLYAWK